MVKGGMAWIKTNQKQIKFKKTKARYSELRRVSHSNKSRAISDTGI